VKHETWKHHSLPARIVIYTILFPDRGGSIYEGEDEGSLVAFSFFMRSVPLGA